MNDAWDNAGAKAVRAGPGTPVDSYVGNEVDITIKHRVHKIHLEAGYSHFFTGSYVQSTEPSEDVYFFYLLTKIGF